MSWETSCGLSRASCKSLRGALFLGRGQATPAMSCVEGDFIWVPGTLSPSRGHYLISIRGTKLHDPGAIGCVLLHHEVQCVSWEHGRVVIDVLECDLHLQEQGKTSSRLGKCQALSSIPSCPPPPRHSHRVRESRTFQGLNRKIPELCPWIVLVWCSNVPGAMPFSPDPWCVSDTEPRVYLLLNETCHI